MTIDDLLKKVKTYNSKDLDIIRKAYDFADKYHKNQKRASGEPYIIHPLHVAYILASMHADTDTICAGLLHDTLEDTKATKEEITKEFNADVANLVDGVTKITNIDYSKDDLNMANTRKLIISLTDDVRIIIVKLADRLHNMRTLEYKSEAKQKEKSLETMDIFAPLAYYIGAYNIRCELEDLALKYLNPNAYNDISKAKNNLTKEYRKTIIQMKSKLKEKLNSHDITCKTSSGTKNITGVYNKLNQGLKLSEIHDLINIKLVVKNIQNCYLALGLVHSMYPPLNNKFKDFICNPKTNMYRSLHTTVFAPGGRLVQIQIRTEEMDKIDNNGLSAFFDFEKEKARTVMQENLVNNYQFFKSLTEITKVFDDTNEFVTRVKTEVLSSKIYVYTEDGDIIELPIGSSPIDFAYKVHTDIGNHLSKAIVNDEEVPLDYRLKNKDRVKIITNKKAHPKEEWLDFVSTTYAKRRIKDYLKVQN